MLRCRVNETGLRRGTDNAALDRMLLGRAGAPAEAQLHFRRYLPTASLGAHEFAHEALRVDFCREGGVDIVRRPTGGGALYLDSGQLTWSLRLPAKGYPPHTLTEWLERHGSAVAAGLRRLGVPARSRAPNDIEVDGRKLAVFFATRHGDILLFQGSVFVDVDAATLLKVLRVPTEKLSAEGVMSTRERLATLSELLGTAPSLEELRSKLTVALREAFSLDCLPGRPSPVADQGDPPVPSALAAEVPLSDAKASLPSRSDGLRAFRVTRGGVLQAEMRIAAGRVVACTIGGSAQCAPADLFSKLGESLVGCTLEDVVGTVHRLLAARSLDLVGFAGDDIVHVIQATLARLDQADQLGLDAGQANTLMVHGEGDAKDILAQATVMLVPYCAKPAWCQWRHRDGCPECGQCEVGDAYRLGRERGMRVVTITNFEHLQKTLGAMREEEVPAYVGMCCESFYLKRQYAFAHAELPAVLMDITGANCYELRQEELAYAGRFTAEARLDGDVVERVMCFVPPVGR